MNKSREIFVEEHNSIKQLLKTVQAAADRYEEISLKYAGRDDVAGMVLVRDAQITLTAEAEKLVAVARGPVDMVFSHQEAASRSGAVNALLNMGVFRALPFDGSSMTAAALAAELKVEKDLLVRLMRSATIVGPFAEVGVEEYAHTPFSRVYLIPELQGVFTVGFDDWAPLCLKMSEFLEAEGWRTPNSETRNPYTYAHQTDGLPIWEWLSKFPERSQAFDWAMVGHTHASMWTIGLFPWKAVLGAESPSDETILVVDVGGGRGHVTRQIKKLSEGVKGRMLLQERPEVINGIAEELTGVEKIVHSFFEPQPVKGALIYYLRHILHDWPDRYCLIILENIAKAMLPGRSRLVIAEKIMPSMGASSHIAWLDFNMMGIAGIERTEKQWEMLLQSAGLTLKTIHTLPGTDYASIEAVLA